MRSLAFIFLIATASAAFAQGAPRTSKRPASVLKGDDDDEPIRISVKKADPAAAALCGDSERALGLALSFAFEQAPEEIRVVAVEDLALLGDARALDAIASLVLDANPKIQAAAVRAAAQFTTLRATQILENVVRHPRLSGELKEQALRALPFQRRDRARDFLAAVAKAPSYNPALRQAAQQSLAVFDAQKQAGATQ